MPAGDGTGPRGEGAMTGRGMGICAGYPAGGYASSPGRRGGLGIYGRGGGRGRGWRRDPAPYHPVYRDQVPTETENLKRQVQMVADTIEQIANRVNQLLQRRTERE
ncbi:MAG: hypothetical protein GF388_06795 [Candidatus Aegiribacteria sp.]|nr:hypothetical protein [Candidatus Aegiribacteria sp.]MBD3294853.1 hypothetical protein [Candidatus Fermentibacteria bacterium]